MPSPKKNIRFFVGVSVVSAAYKAFEAIDAVSRSIMYGMVFKVGFM